jgi:two-component system, cell cycle sensor histidine kinase and response regulator CckA
MSGDRGSTKDSSPGLNARVPEVVVRAAQIEQLYTQVRIGMFASVVAALALAALLWDVVPQERILVWVAAFLGVQIPRHILLQRFRRVERQGAAAVPWGKWFLLGSGATALLFGSSAVVIFPSDDFVHQCVLAVFLGAFAASTAVAHAPLRECYVSSVLLTLLPLLGRFLYQGGESGVVLAAVGLAFVAALLGTGNSLNRMIVTSIQLRFQRDEMLRNLEQAHEMLESSVAERTADLAIKHDALLKEVIERTRAEEALRDSEATLRTLLQAAPIGIGQVSADRTLGWTNDLLCNMLGYSRNELAGHSARILYENEEEYLRVGREKHPDVIRDGKGSVETSFQRKDGSVFDVLLSSSSVFPSDLSHGMVFTAMDITERKASEETLRESEKKYRTILETIADGYHEVDLAGNLTLVNDSMCEIFGYPREELLGVNYRKLMDEDNAKIIFEAYNTVYKTGKPNPGFNYQSIRKDGSIKDVSVSISLIKDADGQPRGFRGIFRDITERKRLQEQLYQAAKMEAIGTLAGGLAHDFNNVLQIVLGYADLIAIDKEKQDKDYQRARLIVDAATRGRDLVNRILTFSRKVETKPRPIDLNHELKQVERLLGRTIPKMIEIDLRLADNLHSINADPTQIEQILLNLAVNAAHAMPEGGKLVFETKNVRLDEEYCRTHLETKPGEYVLLTVSDTGHGMEKEILDRAFEPFFTTKARGEGTGLGLSMVFGIVKSHDGHISCHSKRGAGTVFNIYLPATEIEIAWDPEATLIMPSFGTETILLVDDERPIRDLGKEILTSVGYKVLTASTGLEALGMYAKSQEEISLVILDLIMPEMGGKQCLEQLLKINPQLKVLIASGYCADPSTKEYLETGARGFVTKPFRMKELLQQVRKVLDSD